MADSPERSAFRAGFVAVIGRPNTGKSTLVNAMVGEQISIVTSKPQTTRHSILGILHEPGVQVIFVDTPGIHRGGRKLINRTMNRTAAASLAGADVALFVVDSKGWSRGDDVVLAKLKDAGIPTLLVVNKLDLMERRQDLLPVLQDYQARGTFDEIIPISARRGTNLDRLLELVKARLPDSEPLFPADMTTDRGMEFRISEVFREKLLSTLREEVPYGLAVEVLALEQRDDMWFVDALIWVEKDSHRGIVVGRGGNRLKKISTDARVDLEAMFERRFYVKAHVKVKENWSDNARALRQLGYEMPG
ncbi:MAG: GTPase Era [Gammaproteobacteria bacterium]|nr:MAG: GTPase Era [Gammaproteobacteria bacterium]